MKMTTVNGRGYLGQELSDLSESYSSFVEEVWLVTTKNEVVFCF